MATARSIRRLLHPTIAILLIAALLAGCAGAGTPGQAEPYKIGGLFAITGFNSPLGTPQKETAEMLQERINANGGLNGRPVEIIVYDTESDETKAVTLAKRLIERDNVLAIVGPSSTGESLALIDTVEKAQIPLVSCAASIRIVEPVRPWVFKTPQSDSLAINEIFTYLKGRGITKIALLTASGGFGTTGKEALEKAVGPAGMTIVTAETFGDTDTDMTVQLTKIRGTDAQAVVVWGTNPGPAIIAKNARQLGLRIPIINSHGIANRKFIELAGEAAEGIVFPAGKLTVAKDLPDTDPQKALLLEYAQEFETKYGKSADTFGGHAYDGLTMVFQALENGAKTRADIRGALEKKTGFVGTGGIFNMSPQDHNGLGPGSFVMVKIVNGKWTWER